MPFHTAANNNTAPVGVSRTRQYLINNIFIRLCILFTWMEKQRGVCVACSAGAGPVFPLLIFKSFSIWKLLASADDSRDRDSRNRRVSLSRERGEERGIPCYHAFVLVTLKTRIRPAIKFRVKSPARFDVKNVRKIANDQISLRSGFKFGKGGSKNHKFRRPSSISGLTRAGIGCRGISVSNWQLEEWIDRVNFNRVSCARWEGANGGTRIV